MDEEEFLKMIYEPEAEAVASESRHESDQETKGITAGQNTHASESSDLSELREKISFLEKQNADANASLSYMYANSEEGRMVQTEVPELVKERPEIEAVLKSSDIPQQDKMRILRHGIEHSEYNKRRLEQADAKSASTEEQDTVAVGECSGTDDYVSKLVNSGYIQNNVSADILRRL